MTLVIMAAGLGSRFGGGIKQLQKVDAEGHIIMDYSIHDALKAGFNKIVFIIRRELESEFRAVIGDRIEKTCRERGASVSYVFQEITDMPERTKPLGTCHAVLACLGTVNEPFAVINADDYYGKSAFVSIYNHLKENENDPAACYCMAGFILKNTLSDNGGVTRGICYTDSEGYLTNVVETKNIVKTENGAEADGSILDLELLTSMNMWGFPAQFLSLLEEGYLAFRSKLAPDDNKSEFLLPTYVGDLLKSGTLKVKVLESRDRWFGMTYSEDVPDVINEFSKLIDSGVYTSQLFDDIAAEKSLA